jgi:RimJ/RimL family protein N-acetyltransferase
VRPVDALGPRTLSGRFVVLEPLEERHHDGLRRAASDPELFRHVVATANASDFDAWAGHVRAGTAKGERLAYAVRRLSDGAILGSTSYLDIQPENARVEIGATWYVPAGQGGPVNPEAKLLLLGNAFGAGYNCVYLKTDARNARSRAAILKLGAKQDGILRGHLWREEAGYFRDTVYFSILTAEWPGVRAGLEARLAAFD